MKLLKLLLTLILLAIAVMLPRAEAQTTPASTTNSSVSIATGLTFQQVLAPGVRRALTVQNNNTGSDNCWVLIGAPFAAGDTTTTTRTVAGATLAAAKAAILLVPGGSYTRYQPYIPSDQILATCATSGDSIYVDYQ